MNRLGILAAVLVSVAGVPAVVWAQSAAISGTVTDATSIPRSVTIR